MANKAVRVAVIEGDFASLVGLGFPLSLSLQLQESNLRLDQALWTAKSTKGGFSVSLFWPAPDCKTCKSEVQQKRRKRKPKATSKFVPATHVDASNPPKPSTETARATIATQTHELIPISANRYSASPLSSQQLHCNKVSHLNNNSDGEEIAVCDDDQENKMIDSGDSKEKTTSDDEKEANQEWTQVTRRRKKVSLPPCWKLRFPAHLRAGLHTPSGSSSSSNGEESDHSGSTPVAARTRSKLKT